MAGAFTGRVEDIEEGLGDKVKNIGMIAKNVVAFAKLNRQIEKHMKGIKLKDADDLKNIPDNVRDELKEAGKLINDTIDRSGLSPDMKVSMKKTITGMLNI